MKKNLLLLILFVVAHSCVNAQCFINLGNYTGVEPNPQTLQKITSKSCDLKNIILPSDISNEFNVYEKSFYLHSLSMDKELTSFIKNSITEINSDYYLLINRISSSELSFSKVNIELKLPISNMYPCVTEEFISDLEIIIENNFRSSDDQILKIIEYVSKRLSKVYNCCDEGSNRRSDFECSVCPNDLLTLTKKLEDKGFISVDKLIHSVTGKSNLTTTISSSSNPISDYTIKLDNLNYTKLLVYNSTKFSSYQMNEYIYDDKLETDIPCYEEL